MLRRRHIGLLVVPALVAASAWMVLGAGGGDRDGATDAVGDGAASAAGSGVSARATREEPRAARRRHLAPRRANTPPGAAATRQGHVTGTVVRERDDGVVPAAGAVLTLFLDDAPLDEDSKARETVIRPAATTATADADGRFELDIGPGDSGWGAPRTWRLIARTADGLGSHARGSGAGDIGELELYALGHMRLSVIDDDDDRPLPDAFAYLYAASFDAVPYGVAHADARGIIDVDPAPGAVLVTAPAHGFAEKSNPAGDVELRLGPGLDLAGHVVDDEGAPLAGLRLVVDDDGTGRATHTDDAGAFRFERVGPLDEVYVSLDVHGSKVMRLVGYGDLNARIVVPRRGDVAGVIVFPDGSPAAGAVVEGQRTDADGRFVLWTDGQRRTKYVVATISAIVEGFDRAWTTQRAAQRVTLQRGATTDVRLVLEAWPRSFVNVRVVGPEGRAIPDAFVHAGGLPYAVQRAGGVTRLIVAAAPGTAAPVQASYSGGSGRLAPTTTEAITSARWDDPPIELRLGRLAPVTVRVFAPGGEEIERAEWTTLHVEGGGARLLPDGRIEVPSPGGAYVRIVVETRGLRFDRWRRLPIEAPHELRIEFPRTARVTGRLVGSNGNAIEGAVVVIDNAGRRQGTAPRAPTAADGTFVVGGVPVGRARLYAYRADDEIPLCERAIEVPTNGGLDVGDLIAWPAVELAGRVIAPPGESPAGLTIDVLWNGGRGSAATVSRADGTYGVRVRGTPDAHVTATRRGRLFGVRPVDLTRTQRADVRVTRVGSLRVLLPTAWGRDPFELYVATPDGAAQWEPESDWTEQGRVIVVEDVPSGAWLLRVVHDGATIEQRVLVTPDAATTIDVRRP